MAAAAGTISGSRCGAEHLARCAAWVFALSLLSGCGGGPGTAAPSSGAQSPTLTLPKLAELPAVASITGPAEREPEGSATELYTRIARGAVGCWFGGSGPLKKDYIYHAEADAPSRGGKAEIVVHVRDPSQPNPRGAKAYRIKIDPKDEGSATITTENLKMSEPVAAAMAADVGRWSRGDQGCEGASTAVGWSSGAAAPPRTDPGTSKPKSKSTAKATAKPANRTQP